MAFRPLLAEFAEQRNEFCRSYGIGRLFHRLYRADISFSTDDKTLSDLYISERSSLENSSVPVVPFALEKQLDNLFWDETIVRRPVCLLGSVGSGKSTLIDFYLRRYCPASGIRREEYQKKLILFFDAKTIRDTTDFYHAFFLMLQSVIRHECSRRGYDIDATIKSRPTAPQNIREWVRAALEELSRASDKRRGDVASPFEYIVLVLDNLDQTPIEVQVRAINEIEQWLRTPSIAPWRVFLPMWKSTFKQLQNHRFNLLRGAECVDIGTISAHLVLSIRGDATTAQLALSNEPAAAKAIPFLSSLMALALDRLLLRIHALAFGNIRQMMSLWEAFACGSAAFNFWNTYSQASGDNRRRFEYELLDALIVGKLDGLDHSEHRVANLLEMGHARVHPRDLLIGPHALHLIAQDRQTQEGLVEALTALGYGDENIAKVEESMMDFNFLHQIPTGRGKIEYEIHHPIVHEYIKLQFEPAYVDNLALVTPVRTKFLPRMCKTTAARGDFTRRVETTFAFLEFLRECEDEFRSAERLKRTSAEAFTRALDDLRIPCLWRMMAMRYFDRLLGLRRSGYLRDIADSWWDAAIGNRIFDQAQAEEEYLSSKP